MAVALLCYLCLLATLEVGGCGNGAALLCYLCLLVILDVGGRGGGVALLPVSAGYVGGWWLWRGRCSATSVCWLLYRWVVVAVALLCYLCLLSTLRMGG